MVGEKQNCDGKQALHELDLRLADSLFNGTPETPVLKLRLRQAVGASHLRTRRLRSLPLNDCGQTTVVVEDAEDDRCFRFRGYLLLHDQDHEEAVGDFP